MKSPAFNFKGTGEKLLKSLGWCLLTAFGTWLPTLTVEFDFGVYNVLVGGAITFIVNAINEFIKEKK